MSKQFYLALTIILVINSANLGVSCFAIGFSFAKTQRLYPSKIKHRGIRASAAGIIDEAESNDTKTQYLRGGDIPVIAAKRWPSLDSLDSQLMKIALPCILNFAIAPLVGAVDLFWVNRMGTPLAVAGQAAANQVFNSAFFLASFLPQVTATEVAKVAATGNEEALQDTISQALFVGGLFAFVGTPLLLSNAQKILSVVLSEGAPAMAFAKPYLFIRSFSLFFQMMSVVGFSAFRGILNTVTPVKISIFANMINVILDPIFIFSLAMGVPGAALATVIAEVASAITYLTLLRKKKMIRFEKIFSVPSWKKLAPLLKGGAALQVRNLALNLVFLSVTRVTQGIDETGVAAAAHALAIQTFQVGGIVLLALSTVAATVIPSEIVEKVDKKTGRITGGLHAARAVKNRLMSWGLVLGSLLGIFQLLVLPALHKATPMLEVREAARLPSMLASCYQIFNGMVFIGEGVMIGCGNFIQLSLSTLLSTAGFLCALRTLPKTFGLAGVWWSFGVFNLLRLLGVSVHQLRTGPLALRNIAESDSIKEKEAGQVVEDDTGQYEM
eukprot:CAMPEP_0178916422 /NCGR_PEP_ID=MMETSP0786-20121207/12629_1 /TAXON_ID=186022 /ORGANISM="Thalassionema frauenfeldii, Strain CCMP 1798" /LENGTH=554 /DNA_ID=CAMNT_0020589753 /DNA_START=204 /DNA_END=1868 /DNA_ORIENTATION=+